MLKNQILAAENSKFEHMIITSDEDFITMTPHLTINIVLSGNIHILNGKKSCHCNPDDIFFFPPNTPFQFICSGSVFSIYTIHIAYDYLAELIPVLCNASFDHFYIPKDKTLYLYNSFCHNLASVLFLSVFKNEGNGLKQITAINELLIDIFNEFYIAGHKGKNDRDYVNERIIKILDYIKLNYSQKIRIADISNYLGLHPQYFSLFFTNHFGEKFLDYLNRFRVNHSLSDLIYTDKTLLDIAIECGFQSNKSYSNAFTRYYNMLPSAYRKTYGKKNHVPGEEQNLIHLAAFLYENYWNKTRQADSGEVINGRGLHNNPALLSIDMDLVHAAPKVIDNRIKSIAVGSGTYLLRDEVFDQLARVKEECKFTHVLIRDIFNELLNVYTEPQPGYPVYYWDDLDKIIAKIISLGMDPYIEIDFMPVELSSVKKTLHMTGHPNTGFPKSLQQWSDLITAMLEHYYHIYGDSMLNWYFDFWNTANINWDNGYWADTKENFFLLYKVTYQAFQKVNPDFKLGSPNFSLPDGIDWYNGFFAYCEHEKIRPHYIALHAYSCMDNLEEYAGIFPYTPTTYNYLSLTTKEYIKNMIFFLRNSIDKTSLAGLPIIISDWNVTYYFQDLVRDTAFMAPYIAHTYIQTLENVAGISYFSVSETNEQLRPSNYLFSGDFGLFDKRGIAKPSFFAFSLLHKLDKNVVSYDNNYVVTKSKKGFHVLIYNMSEYENVQNQKLLGYISHDYRYQIFTPTPEIHFQGVFRVPFGTYSIKTYHLDQEHGSVYDSWLAIGKPQNITPDIATFFRHHVYPDLQYDTAKDTSVISLESMIKPHGIILFEVVRTI